jgi:hypothetical protein
MLYLGVRRGDVVTLGRQHSRDGAIRFVPLKTRRKKMHAIEIPILPELAAIIEAGPAGDMTFLMTEWGKRSPPTDSADGFVHDVMKRRSPNAVRTGCERPERPSQRNGARPIGS